MDGSLVDEYLGIADKLFNDRPAIFVHVQDLAVE
jgi:hypothetical protein